MDQDHVMKKSIFPASNCDNVSHFVSSTTILGNIFKTLSVCQGDRFCQCNNATVFLTNGRELLLKLVFFGPFRESVSVILPPKFVSLLGQSKVGSGTYPLISLLFSLLLGVLIGHFSQQYSAWCPRRAHRRPQW